MPLWAASTETEPRSKNRLRRFDLAEAPRATDLSRQPSQGLHLLPHAQGQGVVPHSSFTDHFIRVHRENSPARGR